MSANAQPKLVKPVPVMRRVVIYGILLFAAFLLGFIPMWIKDMDTSRGRVEAERQLSLAQGQVSLSAIQAALDTSVIEAQRGNYQPARLAASSFFATLRAETERGEASALSSAQREGVAPVLAQQDEIITLLARGSAASVNRLYDLYDSYLEIVAQQQ